MSHPFFATPTQRKDKHQNSLFFPTAESFGVSACLSPDRLRDSGVVRGGPEVRFSQASTRFCEGCGMRALKRTPHITAYFLGADLEVFQSFSGRTWDVFAGFATSPFCSPRNKDGRSGLGLPQRYISSMWFLVLSLCSLFRALAKLCPTQGMAGRYPPNRFG